MIDLIEQVTQQTRIGWMALTDAKVVKLEAQIACLEQSRAQVAQSEAKATTVDPDEHTQAPRSPQF